jgi:hypothetical protein
MVRDSVRWFTYSPELDRINRSEVEASRVVTASSRLRTSVAIHGLRRAGVDAMATIDSAELTLGRRIVVGKLKPTAADALAIARFFDERRFPNLIVDYSEHKPEDHAYTQTYAALFALASSVTCNSEAMADLAASHFRLKQKPEVIPDAYDYPALPVRFAAGEVLNFLWYGSRSNLDPLLSWLSHPSLAGFKRRMKISILSNLASGDETAIVESCAKHRIEPMITPWSLEAVPAAAAAADFILIPNDPDKPRKRGISSNRLISALRLGRLPIASPLPAYREFAEFCLLTSEPGAAVNDALQRREEMSELVSRGQHYVSANFSPDTLGVRWAKTILGR